MATLGKKHAELFTALGDIRNEMDLILDDESVNSFPKAFKKLGDDFDAILQKMEDGEFQEEAEEEEGDDVR